MQIEKRTVLLKRLIKKVGKSSILKINQEIVKLDFGETDQDTINKKRQYTLNITFELRLSRKSFLFI
jgi:hypothetical protein